MVSLVDDEVFELGQQAASDLGIGEQQGVVDNDDVRRLGLGSGPVHVAVLLSAVDAHAVQRIGCDARPEDFLAAV